MDRNNTIKEMYREERPYEKCEQYGAENLTDAELLAVLLRTGTKGCLLYTSAPHSAGAGADP